MEPTNIPSKANDYAVAKALNESLLSIFKALRSNDEYLPPSHGMVELNRLYVLMVHELERMYGQNSELATLKPEPFWKRYDVLDTFSDEILDYLDEPEVAGGRTHNIRLDKLCIIANHETPELTSVQKKLIEDIDKAVQNYYADLNGAMDAVHLPIIAKETEYVLSYKDDGRIILNDALELKKTHIGSTIDMLLEQAFKNQYELFIPKLPKTARNLSTVLSSAGFTPELRKIFFPVTSKSKGVLFRPVVARSDVKSEGIDTTVIDYWLTKLYADGIFTDMDSD